MTGLCKIARQDWCAEARKSSDTRVRVGRPTRASASRPAPAAYGTSSRFIFGCLGLTFLPSCLQIQVKTRPGSNSENEQGPQTQTQDPQRKDSATKDRFSSDCTPESSLCGVTPLVISVLGMWANPGSSQVFWACSCFRMPYFNSTCGESEAN